MQVLGINLLLILGSYLLGSVPTLYLLGKLRGIELSQEKDLHIALWYKVGRGEAALGIALDIAKGALPILFARWLGFSPAMTALAGLAALIGQMWPPPFRSFHGEKGNSTGLGMAAFLAPQALLISLVPIVIGAGMKVLPLVTGPRVPLKEWLHFRGAPSRSLPLGMAIGFALLPLFSWWLGQPSPITFACLAIFLLIILRRLTAGIRQESKTSSSLGKILLCRLLYD